jgi:cystathionine beta-lyase
MSYSKYKIETQLVHAGRNPAKYDGMVNTPVFRTSTILFNTIEEIIQLDKAVHTDQTYGRSGTPTVKELQDGLAKLDGVNKSIVVSSGMNAVSIVMQALLQSGDHILITEAAYKCTSRFADEELSKSNIETTYYDPKIGSDITNLIKPNTKVIWLESPGSGTFEIQDISAITKIAKEHGIKTVIDNTWATPLFLQPFKYGVDVSIQSLTKYISGHSDIILGAISATDEVYPTIYKTFRNYGTICCPDYCFLALRGLRTLEVRLKRHQENALHIAKWLEKHPLIDKVLHPALQSFEGNLLWKQYFTGSTGLFSFILKDCSEEKLFKFINSLELFGKGLSWGGFETLILPYKLDEKRAAKTLKNGGHLVRVHIGLENPDDLVLDLNNALKYIEN